MITRLATGAFSLQLNENNSENKRRSRVDLVVLMGLGFFAKIRILKGYFPIDKYIKIG
tara:strand:+ start:129247 stop:129420 length:174 start_codon:yes stop_codon:yes gene_type:complete